MTRVISASGSKAQVLETLRRLCLADTEPSLARVVEALTEHVEREVEPGNRLVEVFLSIGAKFNDC